MMVTNAGVYFSYLLVGVYFLVSETWVEPSPALLVKLEDSISLLKRTTLEA